MSEQLMQRLFSPYLSGYTQEAEAKRVYEIIQSELEELRKQLASVKSELELEKDYRKVVEKSLKEEQSDNKRLRDVVEGIKRLKAFDATVMETDGQSATFETAVVVYHGHIKRLIASLEMGQG